MSSIESKVPAIAGLHFDKLPSGRPKKVVRVVCMKTLTLFVDQHGRLYCNDLGLYHYTIGNYWFLEPLLKALVKLKAITQADADAHIKHVKESQARRDKSHALKTIESIADQYGFEVTPEQMESLS